MFSCEFLMLNYKKNNSKFNIKHSKLLNEWYKEFYKKVKTVEKK